MLSLSNNINGLRKLFSEIHSKISILEHFIGHGCFPANSRLQILLPHSFSLNIFPSCYPIVTLIAYIVVLIFHNRKSLNCNLHNLNWDAHEEYFPLYYKNTKLTLFHNIHLQQKDKKSNLAKHKLQKWDTYKTDMKKRETLSEHPAKVIF